MTIRSSNPFGSLFSSFEQSAILGGDTAVTLSSASTLASLGISVNPLGTATLSTTGGAAVATFGITGGTVGGGREVVLHQGSGLALKDASGEIDLQDFKIDTENHDIDANVTINGKPVGDIAVFDIGADGRTLTLTKAAAAAVDQTLHTTAITSDTVIGTAQIDARSLGFSVGTPSFIRGGTAGFAPVIGGDTAVTLTSAPTLTSLGVTVRGIGTANVVTGGSAPVANFPITGGTVNPDGTEVILHQGSGLQLSDAAGSIALRDFVVDVQNHVIDANVSVNGMKAGNLAVFDIGAGGALTLTATAAAAADRALGTTAITSSTQIGTAQVGPLAAPSGFASLFGFDNQPPPFPIALAH